MAGRRVETDRLREVVRLHRMGTSARAVARLLRMGPNTERRYRRLLERTGLLAGSVEQLPALEDVRAAVDAEWPAAREQPVSSIDGWRPRIKALLDKGLTARAVLDRLRLEARGGEGAPCRASYSAVKRACRALRREHGVRAEDVAIPVATRPGESMQVDFGYAGRLYDPARGVVRRAWVFVALLTHSRHQFVRLVFDQKVETWLRLHEQAFAAFGGCVATVLPDNCRRAVLRAAFGLDGPTELERSYRELARAYGFKIDPAPPGSPWIRGKVEAAVNYVRNGPLKARDGEPIDVVEAALQRWNREVASVRVHGTTGRRPIEVFEREERPALRALRAEVYDLAVWKRARVHPDSHVVFRDRLYSVPWHLLHEAVWIRASRQRIDVLHDDRVVATHERTNRWRTTVESHLPADRRDLRHRGRALWEERAARVGPETLGLVRAIFDSDLVLSRLRQVQAIVGYLERHPRFRAEAASGRARRLGDLDYQSVRRTLTLGLDLLAVPPQVAVPGV